MSRLPTSHEYAQRLIPRVKAVMKERKPFAAFLAGLLPILKVIIPIILQLLPLLMALDTGPSRAAQLPWSDDPDSIPEDVQRAARMEV